MASYTWYLGAADVRNILAADWTRMGIANTGDVTWQRSNSFSVDQSTLSAGQIAWLATQPEFMTSQLTIRPSGTVVSDPNAPVSQGQLAAALASISKGGVWSTPSPLGSTKRAATAILMSTYDTNPSSTDHTAAFQAALNAAATMIDNGALVVQIILDSRQKYLIGGAVTAGANGQWAQVQLPYRPSLSGSSGYSFGTIQLVGMPMAGGYSYIGGNRDGTVIESTLSAAPAFTRARGIASVFGGPSSFSSAHSFAGGSFSGLRFAVKDLTIRAATPVIAGIDAGWVTGFSWEGQLAFDTDATEALLASGYGGVVAPVCTNPQAIPLITPFVWDFFGTTGDVLVCSGWLGGPYLGEFCHIHRVVVFNTAGAALYVDTSNQQSLIDYLVDWDNAYGIATTDPGSGATPISMPYLAGAGNKAPGSQQNGTSPPLLATALTIGAWEVQRLASGATARVYDVLDDNNQIYVDCPSWTSNLSSSPYTYDSVPALYSAGSTTGIAHTKRIKAKWSTTTSNSPAMPPSNTYIRNPYGRDCLVTFYSGTIAGIYVQNVAQADIYAVIVPANGIIAVSYSAAPTWVWQAI